LRGLSQLKLAELCDSSQAYIAEIEIGKKFPSPDMIERIAAALKLESYCLFQNKPAEDNRVLTTTQRQEIVKKMNGSIKKILDLY